MQKGLLILKQMTKTATSGEKTSRLRYAKRKSKALERQHRSIVWGQQGFLKRKKKILYESFILKAIRL